MQPSTLPISVIIPCYNSSDTIIRAINSVMAQVSLPREIIIIDDCSDDNLMTIKTLTQLKAKSNKVSIKIISLNINQGPGSARNAGWEIASEPFIAFLDADDSWHPQKLLIQYKWMINHPDVLMTAHASLRYPAIEFKYNLNSFFKFTRVDPLKLLFFNVFPTRSVMIKKNINYRFKPGKRYAEDYLLWLTMCYDNNSIYYLDLGLCYSFGSDFGEPRRLSANLYKMHRGVLDVYKQLFKNHMISFFLYSMAVIFAYMKYFKRYFQAFYLKLFHCLLNF